MRATTTTTNLPGKRPVKNQVLPLNFLARYSLPPPHPDKSAALTQSPESACQTAFAQRVGLTPLRTHLHVHLPSAARSAFLTPPKHSNPIALSYAKPPASPKPQHKKATPPTPSLCPVFQSEPQTVPNHPLATPARRHRRRADCFPCRVGH